MTDRELLELAAKAAGIEGEWDDGYEAFVTRRNASGIAQTVWSPLTDDGDALRLAVTLNIDVLQRAAGECWAQAPMVRTEIEPYGTDAGAATRRAIVRAAAAVGEAMV